MASLFGLGKSAAVSALENLKMVSEDIGFSTKKDALLRIRDAGKTSDKDIYLLNVFIQGIDVYNQLRNLAKRSSSPEEKAKEFAEMHGKKMAVLTAIQQATDYTSKHPKLKNDKINVNLRTLRQFIMVQEKYAKDPISGVILDNAMRTLNRSTIVTIPELVYDADRVPDENERAAGTYLSARTLKNAEGTIPKLGGSRKKFTKRSKRSKATKRSRRSKGTKRSRRSNKKTRRH